MKLAYLDAPWPNFRLLNIVKFLDSYFTLGVPASLSAWRPEGKTDVTSVRTALESPRSVRASPPFFRKVSPVSGIVGSHALL